MIKDYKIITGVVLLIFIISSNIAWLNPRPEYVVKFHDKIPFMWQNLKDSKGDFLAAAYFPGRYKEHKSRINRPGYPLIVNSIGKMSKIIFSPAIERIGYKDGLVEGFIGWIVLKFSMFLIGSLIFYRLVERFFNKNIALFSVIIFLFNPVSVFGIGEFNTRELQYFTPIIITYLFIRLTDNYTLRYNIVFSLIVGFLMLCKQNYAIYLTILVFSVFHLNSIKLALISFIIHLIPVTLWIIYLKINGLAYYNVEIQKWGSIIWLFNDLIFRNPIEIIKITTSSFIQYVSNPNFGIIYPIALLSVRFKLVRNIFTKNRLYFVLYLIIFTWFQHFASNFYSGFEDIMFIIIPLATCAIIKILEKIKKPNYIRVIVPTYLLYVLLSIAKFPWIHPYDQKDVLAPYKNGSIESEYF